VRFTVGASDDRCPVWSPDGQQIYFNSNRDGGNDLYRKAVTGAGQEERIFADSGVELPYSISSDGRYLFFSRPDAKGGWDVWLLQLAPGGAGGKAETRVFLQSPFDELRARISPDGSFVAFQSTESGDGQVYVEPVPVPARSRRSHRQVGCIRDGEPTARSCSICRQPAR
jgi:Tol biopolymer transport system component